MDLVLRQRLQRLRRPAFLGTIRRTRPLSDTWGRDRGSPVDRYYVERFLESHGDDIHGRVLEVADSRYTTRFGRGVVEAAVLDKDPSNTAATIVADLADPDALPEAAFDCFIVTQTLQYVFDVTTAVAAIHRLLRPGGVALVTVPSVTRIAASAGVDGDYWRFTGAACTRLFADFQSVEISSYGNVLANVAFLVGMAREELSRRELDRHDPFFPLLVCVRARKSG